MLRNIFQSSLKPHGVFFYGTASSSAVSSTNEVGSSSLEFDFERLNQLGVAKKSKPPQINLSKLKNGLRVVSVDYDRPDSSVTLVIPAAGTRLETVPGLSHVYKNFLFKSSEQRTAFRLVRELENKGVDMMAQLGRESLNVTVRGLRPFVSDAMEFALDSVTHPNFAHYELESVKNLVRLETLMAESCGLTSAWDQLHRAAYRSNLGYSLFASSPSLERITLDSIKSMSDEIRETADSMILVGINVNHVNLIKIAERTLESLKKTKKIHWSSSSTYYGGDAHKDFHGPTSHWMVAFEGPGRFDKDYMATAMVYALLGMNKIDHLGFNYSGSMLGDLFQDSLIKTACCSLHGVHVTYTNSSLVGVHIELEDTKHLALIVEKLMHKLRHLVVTNEKVAYARSQLKWLLPQSHMCRSSFTDHAISQLLGMDKPITPLQDLLSHVDRITTAEVAQAAQRLFSSKPSSSFHGHLRDAPFIDQF